eukprot:CAMPEP_0181201876 /NCGR_PEP_ID=MMETSP1096-20121128/18535_1 /TAXON_ID=156174 ORGANISM="Chrysochromulina ericina, Strain CCMP281" /NCGR_SAMPLE_ID=MMETSP1096 /ASSEMBLY_ACC=CAM_ASM_000453 /LENGTH=107 /DNA_ID=CAMNT_0023292337 /DNA_START=421 /DNA_END=744 /DNA_ORIENTATION=-
MLHAITPLASQPGGGALTSMMETSWHPMALSSRVGRSHASCSSTRPRPSTAAANRLRLSSPTSQLVPALSIASRKRWSCAMTTRGGLEVSSSVPNVDASASMVASAL